MIGLALVRRAARRRGRARAPATRCSPVGGWSIPSGYANANAAQWLMAFWPALLLARSARLPWALRGLLAGGAVLLAEVALLSQSRGSLYATPVMLVLVFALLPGRARTFALLVPGRRRASAAAAPAVLRVGDHLEQRAARTAPPCTAPPRRPSRRRWRSGWSWRPRRRDREPAHALGERARRVRTGVRRGRDGALVAVLAGGLVAAGNPVTRVNTAGTVQGRLRRRQHRQPPVSGLGSNRYDFYRVALDEFAAHPLLGIGADNFQQQYLAHGRSEETPTIPHSVELRTLAETGLVGRAARARRPGAALLAAAGAALRSPDPLARAVAAAALAGFAYWVVHGSFDWFWEFAGLGAPAFALLGLACALAPRRREAPSPRSASRAEAPSSAAPAPVGVGVPGARRGRRRGAAAASRWRRPG